VHERADRDSAHAGRETVGERRAPAPEHARVLALQQSAGNLAVSALLSRQAAPPAPTAGTQAAAEAEALRTLVLLRDTYYLMLKSPDLRVHNTALMMDPPGEREQGGRVRATPMTLRSDSATLVARNGKDPAATAYYFYGAHQDNTHEDDTTTLGTIQGGSTVVIRGTRSNGSTQTSDNIIETLVHETSHILVKDYGEHPGTSTDAGSFDRYRDEFRSYFLAPHSTFAAIADPDARAAAIRDHIVGASAGAGSYPDLDKAFWAAPLDTNQFHHDVLAHKRPDGFNLDNSPYLDRLVHLLRDEQAGGASVEDVLFQIAILSPKERGEAAGATLIATLLVALPARDAARIQRALTSPTAVGYGRELNPGESARVTALLDAITARTPDGITDAYKACNPTERGELAANAYFVTWLKRALPSELLMRTCVTCMIHGGSFVYFDRVRVFAQACSDAAGQPTMPDPLRAALRALPFEVRIAYFGLCQDDYAARVEPLQDPVKREVRAILRGDAEP
jgi:hypothetical protein